jgi:hypothetical protein
MGKYSFNVACDSSNNYFSQINGSTTQFNFNWALVKDCKYDLTFSYMSDDTTTTLSPVMTLWTDFNCAENTYLANATTASPNINLLGCLRADKHGANGYYYADENTNPPVRVQRPSNNTFTIFLRNALTSVAYATPVASQYVLILHFKEVDYD